MNEDNNYDINIIERNKYTIETLKKFIECVENNNLNEYEKEYELKRIVYEFVNNINDS